MENKKKRIIIVLGGNALGNTLSEQTKVVKIITKAIVDLIKGGCEAIVAHSNGPQVGMIGNVMATLSRRDVKQPNTPLSVCVAISQTCIGCDLQNTLREELCNREIYDIPAAIMTTQVRVDVDDLAFEAPSKPIGHFMIEEQAKIVEKKYRYVMREDSGCGYRHVVASPKPARIAEIGAIRSLVDLGQLVIAYGGDGILATHQGNHLRGANTVIDKDLTSELLVGNLNADSLIILTAVGRAAVNFGKPEEKWLDDLDMEKARQLIEKGYLTPGSMLPKVQATVKSVESKPGRIALITLLEKVKDDIQGKAGTYIHLA